MSETRPTEPASQSAERELAAMPGTSVSDDGAVLDYHGNPVPPNYKWLALSNTTLGVLIATINASILLISLPDIFKGIHIDPLDPSNTNYLLWLILGFLVVTAVLVVSLGRLGDIYGRARTFNLGFAVFTLFSVLLSVTWLKGSAGALWLIGMRCLQGVGGAMLFANSSAIITDAFPARQRGLALGINGVAAVAGSSIGLVLGGVLAPVAWRAVFLVSVPFGVFGTFWGYRVLRDLSPRGTAKIDWWGNITFAVGLIAVMVGITYGIQPYGHHTMGWTSPKVISEIGGGLVVLAIFCFVETRVEQPMFHLELFKNRAFTLGNFASLLSGIGRGGLQFVLIIWLQGVYLPRHGYSFSSTPLWAGILLLPLVGGMLVAGPIAGTLSDKIGPRPFAIAGMLVAALSFLLLALLPVNFSYPVFALVILLNGLGMGIFFSPNRASIMNSLPPNQRGAGGGMAATFMNSAMVLSIGIFFSLMIVGLSGGLSHSLYTGLHAHGVRAADAHKAANLPPVSTLFAAFLGYNPVKTLLGSSIHHVPVAQQHILLGHKFFPQVISGPFSSALTSAFIFGLSACLIAALASIVPAKGVPLIISRRRRDATGTAEGDDGATAPAYPKETAEQAEGPMGGAVEHSHDREPRPEVAAGNGNGNGAIEWKSGPPREASGEPAPAELPGHELLARAEAVVSAAEQAEGDLTRRIDRQVDQRRDELLRAADAESRRLRADALHRAEEYAAGLQRRQAELRAERERLVGELRHEVAAAARHTDRVAEIRAALWRVIGESAEPATAAGRSYADGPGTGNGSSNGDGHDSSNGDGHEPGNGHEGGDAHAARNGLSRGTTTTSGIPHWTSSEHAHREPPV